MTERIKAYIINPEEKIIRTGILDHFGNIKRGLTTRIDDHVTAPYTPDKTVMVDELFIDMERKVDIIPPLSLREN